MNEQHLREQLERLATELNTLPADNDKRASIDALIADIELQLNEGVADDSLVDQVEAAVSSFEVEHPRIAGVLNNILTTLGNIGV
ncbi:MAG: hypothetical protein JWM78_1709 [Verrucomicrobiaceae bacterium]|nr:hypothetical protein [Verrucomicrobiaceae bacterium]